MIFETLRSLSYGELHFGFDVATGMRAIIALHSTKLGPAIGGLRVRRYESEADAVDDVTRLAQGMTYKNAVAGLRHGGGKSVILALSISPEGRATACRIHRSSGLPDTDAVTCRLAMERLRFKPATNAVGDPVTATFYWQQKFFF